MKMSAFGVLAGFLSLLAAGSGVAAEEIAAELGANPTLEEYVSYAVAHNPGLSAAHERFMAAAERPAQAKTLPEPLVTYKYSIQSDNERQSLGIEQMMPWPGKLKAAEGAAGHRAESKLHEYENDAAQLAYRVSVAYCEYYYLGRAIAITADNLDLLKQVEKVARARYSVSEASYADVLRAQVELGKLDDELRALEDMKGPAAARLNAAINRPAGEERPFPEALAEEDLASSDDELLERLLAGNPELAAMASDIRAAQAMIAFAKKQSRPDFMAGVEWRDMKKTAMGKGEDMWMAMVGVSIPIWRAKYRAAETEARHERLAAAAQRQETANSLSAELREAAFGFRDARRKSDLYGRTLAPKAEQALKAVQVAYEAGSAQFTDLVDAQGSLLEFQMQYERARADRAKSLAWIRMLLGGSEKGDKTSTPAAAPNIEDNK